MTDVARERLMRLMAEIEALEESAEALEQKLRASRSLPDSRNGAATKRELRELLDRLEQKRSELTRVSNLNRLLPARFSTNCPLTLI